MPPPLPAPAAAAEELPSCAAVVDAGEVKKTIENSAASKLVKIEVFSVTDSKDNGMMSSKRRCSALVWANLGKYPIDFTLERMPDGDTWIQIEDNDIY